MKPIIYFFGTLPEGFSSYPQDHTKKIFEGFISRSKNTCQIVLHRKDNLLHYGYVRRMSGNNFFGICLCIDCIYNNINSLFNVFDDIYSSMIQKGDILKIGSGNKIYWATKKFISETVSLTEYTKQVIDRIAISDDNTQPLPPANFSISINDCLELSLESSSAQIADATKRYTNLYIVKNESDIERVSSFRQAINRKDDEIRSLKTTIQNQKKEAIELNKRFLKVKAQQRNLKWVSVLGAVVLVLAFILWNKVLFPSEVTHYETNEFVYYGPLKNKKPHGVGVAIYYDKDKSGRHYYIGNFDNGLRHDNDAIMFYKDGSYFKGVLREDKWIKGTFYDVPLDEYFRGTFKNNNPFTGDWYEYRKVQHVEEGNS